MVGKLIGKLIAGPFVGLVSAIAATMRIAAGLWKGLISGVRLLSPLFEVVTDGFMSIVDAILDVAESLGFVTGVGDEFGGMWEDTSRVIGFVLGTAIMPLVAALALIGQTIKVAARVIAITVSGVVGTFRNLWEFMRGMMQFVTGDFSGGWKTMKDAATSQLQTVVEFFKGALKVLKDQFNTFLDFIANTAAKIPEKFRPGSLDTFIAQRAIRTETIDDTALAKAESRRFSLNELNAIASRPVVPFANHTAGAAEAGNKRGGPTADEFKTAMSEVLEDFARNRSKKPQQQQTFKLVADGAVLATAQKSAGQTDAALNFGGDFFGDD
jgi:phage-related protein